MDGEARRLVAVARSSPAALRSRLNLDCLLRSPTQSMLMLMLRRVVSTDGAFTSLHGDVKCFGIFGHRESCDGRSRRKVKRSITELIVGAVTQPSLKSSGGKDARHNLTRLTPKYQNWLNKAKIGQMHS